MDTTYRQTELENARKEVIAARAAYESATTRKAKREAAENLEFWTNRSAILANHRHDLVERTNTAQGRYGPTSGRGMLRVHDDF